MRRLKNLREVLKGLKHKKLSKPTSKFCPKCGDHEIRLSIGSDTYPQMFGITPSTYICERCGYNGPIAMELEEDS